MFHYFLNKSLDAIWHIVLKLLLRGLCCATFNKMKHRYEILILKLNINMKYLRKQLQEQDQEQVHFTKIRSIINKKEQFLC